jgi:hypothetical protein
MIALAEEYGSHAEMADKTALKIYSRDEPTEDNVFWQI